MAAKRVTQSAINWASIAERVPADQKPQFLLFKSKADALLRKVAALPENPPKIDWAMYKSKAPLPAMVDEFQKKYEAFKIPVPEDNVSSIIAAEEKESASAVKKFKEESVRKIATIQEELKRYDGRVPLEQMTMEDFAYHYPELSIDTTNKPTYWPHDAENQPGPEDEKDNHGH